MKIKKLNEFYNMNRHINDDKAYIPQTENELIYLVHTLFHDYFNGNLRINKNVMNDIVIDVSGIKDASPATQMIVAKNNFTFEDMEYIYFLGISADEWKQNKKVFKKSSNDMYLDFTCCEFGLYTKAECNDISICVSLGWDYTSNEYDDIDVYIHTLTLNEIRYGRNPTIPAKAFEHLPCYEALKQYFLELIGTFNRDENIIYELYCAAKRDMTENKAMKMDEEADRRRDKLENK